jgi:hypothetical protein
MLTLSLRAFVLAKPVLDGDILSLNSAELAQLLPERLREDRTTGSSVSIQVTYAWDFLRLLRFGYDSSSKQYHYKQD